MTLKLIVIEGAKAGMEIPISGPEFRIGRGGDCHLRPQNPLVSRRHCLISIDNGLATIADCGSGNGTFVNGEKLQRQHQLKDADRIKIGTLELEVRLETQGGVKNKQPTHVPHAERKEDRSRHAEREEYTSAAESSHAPCEGIHNDDVDFLGWIDGTSIGEANKRQTALTPAPSPATGEGRGNRPTLTRSSSPTTNLRSMPGEGRNDKPLPRIPEGDGKVGPSAHIPSPFTATGEGRKRQTALLPNPSHEGDGRSGEDILPLAGGGRTYGVAGEENDDRAAADLLADVDGLLDNSFGQVGNLPHDEWTVSDLQEEGDQASKEWDGSELLLFAALGILLVVVLSSLFPMSWPEGFSVAGWLRLRLQNWWHIWWLRWGTVIVLVAVLMKLLHIRAKSEHGNRPRAAM